MERQQSSTDVKPDAHANVSLKIGELTSTLDTLVYALKETGDNSSS